MKRAIVAFLGVVLVGIPHLAKAELIIDVTQGVIEPVPIAVPDFIVGSGESGDVAQDIANVVRADLERSGLFRAIPQDAIFGAPTTTEVVPNFEPFRLVGALALVIGEVTIAGDVLSVDFRLWDVAVGQSMTGLSLSAGLSSWRRVAHKVADAIYERITGEVGYFDTRLVFISESGPRDLQIKRLSIMDQDGANHHFLTNGDTLVLTPRFSPTRQEITYLAYYDGTPRVYLFNIDTGEQELLGNFPNMTFSPRFSPDGDSVIMSLAERGNTDIFVMDLRTRNSIRLTRNPAIDTHPSYSPDGREIVFESDRSGSQQLYAMTANGGNQRRITFSEGRYGTPVWSPRGDLIAFTKIADGQFHIGVMRPDGSGERILTSGFLVEGPTWSPNGRVLMFFRQTPMNRDGSGGGSNLYSIDLTGLNERLVRTPVEASDPAWAPVAQ